MSTKRKGSYRKNVGNRGATNNSRFTRCIRQAIRVNHNKCNKKFNPSENKNKWLKCVIAESKKSTNKCAKKLGKKRSRM